MLFAFFIIMTVLVFVFMLVMLFALFIVMTVDVFAEFDRADALDCLMGRHAVGLSSLDYVEEALFESSAVANEYNCALHRCHLLG